MKNIGLLGCGTIGTQIALSIDSGKINAKLTHVYDQDKKQAEKLVEKLQVKPQIVNNSHLLSSNSTDIIVEAASQTAVKDVALSILQNRKELVIMSVGALLDESIREVLFDACREFERKIYLPSGAIAGIDALKSLKNELDSVTLITTKHPDSLRGAKFFETSDIKIDGITDSVVIFNGNAKKAVELFPANVNVAALLSLAGIGSTKTMVQIVADPNVSTNTHKVLASGRFGSIQIELKNIPDPNNPKTSKLASLSAIQLLDEICSNKIKIGT